MWEAIVGGLTIAVSVILWFARLENKTNNALKEGQELEKRIDKEARRIDKLYDCYLDLDKKASRQSDILERMEKDFKELKKFIQHDGYERLKSDLAKEIVLELNRASNG